MNQTNPQEYKGFACSGFCCTKIENFGVAFGSAVILEDVNLHIHCGELTAIIGPNGAGKSTLLKAILGDIRHTGKLKYLDAKGQRSGNPLIGYVPQHLAFDRGSPVSVLDLFNAAEGRLPVFLQRNRKTKARVEESLSIVKAQHLVDRKLGALSGGELQRVLLALALDPIPDLLLLDEPVSGIDQKGLELFYKTVSDLRREYDLSIILVSHDLDLVEHYADRAILINKTVLSQGTPQEVFDGPDARELFGSVRFGREAYDETQEGGN
ncbi:MAG: metal ABC transporter ATP-binding protein [Clostridiales bacterium]|nr:metal ABC transporter ATP-binding protein [Clostridiales bacterium]